jgi:galactokinase
VDTRAPHRHADGEYRARREGCERAAQILGVPALRDVSPDQLDEALGRLPDERLRGYTRHVVTENARVEQAVACLEAGRLGEVGELLTASHRSLRDDFLVSVPELDAAVSALLSAGALGARLTGGGFGGSVIALVGADAACSAADAVAARFTKDGFAQPSRFVARPGPGAHRVS